MASHSNPLLLNTKLIEVQSGVSKQKALQSSGNVTVESVCSNVQLAGKAKPTLGPNQNTVGDEVVGAMVGELVGELVGVLVGELVGGVGVVGVGEDVVGEVVGLEVGEVVGVVGVAVGVSVGDSVGAKVVRSSGKRV